MKADVPGVLKEHLKYTIVDPAIITVAVIASG